MRMPLELEITLEKRIQEMSNLGNDICRAMQDCVTRLLPEFSLNINYTEAQFRVEKDPYSNEYSLHGKWLNPQGMNCGSILFHADGTFFAEYDVVSNHPDDSRWFIEAVTAWGRGDSIKTEPRLIERV